MDLSYRDYCTEATFHKDYIAYQERYRVNMKESDRAMIGHIARTLPDTPEQRHGLRLLDIGCSTGYFLRHLRNAFPGLSLMGADLTVEQVEACRRETDLAGIEFAVMDLLELGVERQFDRIVANAVAYLLTPEEYQKAMHSISRALKPGGYYLAYEWLHPHPQELQIIEWGSSHPNGLKMHMRSYNTVRGYMAAAGFEDVQFHPFKIPIDLTGEKTCKDAADGFEDLNTYTVRTETGERIMFRGALAQPWCHLIARKAR